MHHLLPLEMVKKMKMRNHSRRFVHSWKMKMMKIVQVMVQRWTVLMVMHDCQEWLYSHLGLDVMVIEEIGLTSIVDDDDEHHSFQEERSKRMNVGW